MTFAKTIGWLLLFFGVAIIFFSLYFSYNIFTGASSVPEIFESNESFVASPPSPEPENIEKMVGEQLKGMILVGMMPKLLNFIVWSIMAGILIFGGSQIASLGIKLIKKP